MSELRVVVDTSVIVSAMLLPNSVPRRAVDFALSEGKVLISSATLDELAEVLRRSKFDRYLRKELRLEFLAAWVNQAEAIEITQTIKACRDPSDDKLLELAVSGNTTHIVTGDHDVLALMPFRGIAIVSPYDFALSGRD